MNDARLLTAVRKLYSAGKWECKTLSVEKQVKLWENLRNAAKIKEGTATKKGVGNPSS